MKRVLLCLMMMVSLSALGQNTLVHIVQRGETLASIAKKYKTSVSDIRAGNPEAKSDIYPGMRLEIPVKGAVSASELIASQGASTSVAYTYQTEQQSAPVTATSESTPAGVVGGQDYTFMLDPDNKIYGLRMSTCAGSMIGMTLAFQWEARSHGTYASLFGIGLSPRYATGPFLMGFHLYPYVSFVGYDEAQLNDKNKVTYKNKTKVSYGAALDLMAGIKLWTTQKGTCVFLTGSYEVGAPEFKTEGAFKNGLWGIGITVIGD